MLAQRARAASRILEQQVGTNDRIRVQRDDAFVLWDEIPFATKTGSEEAGTVADEAITASTAPHQAPEWLRRTICCARWEVDNAKGKPERNIDSNDPAEKEGEAMPDSGPKPLTPPVIVAVCTSALDTLQPQDSTPLATSPVPLPPPPPQQVRCMGTLVKLWAEKAGVTVYDVKPTAPPTASVNTIPNAVANRDVTRPRHTHGHGRGSSDEDWRGGAGNGGPIKINTVRRSSASAPKPRPGAHADPSGTKPIAIYGPGRGRGGGGGGMLVERPAATMAMNASMMQPSKVIRVLARGEKLDP